MGKYDFSDFALKLKRAPTSGRSYSRYGGRDAQPVCGGRLDLDDINHILEGGDPAEFRQLSYYYYRISGMYRNAVLLMANLPLYQTLTTPIFDIDKKSGQDQMMKKFYQALRFVDNLEVPMNFSRISLKTILSGMYYGILRQDGETYTIQDLPEKYCRSRFKDCSNLNIIEFNLAYFNTIDDEKLREECVYAFPDVIRKAWRKFNNNKMSDPWVQITAEDGGCCFSMIDGTPLFISAIPQIYKMEQAITRESTRDENELYKLLIERMPVNSKGELAFTLDETAIIHSNVADMLKDIDTVDVLTTFGDVSLENLQDTTAASQSADRLEKYKNNVYNSLGLSSLYFNADTSSSLPYANAKDEAIISLLTEQYAKWIEYQVNQRYSKSNLTFDVTILNTTRINYKDIQSQFFQGAQYGYSKMAAGVASGIKQVNMLPIMDFENNYLHMTEHMIPLASSFTSSGTPGEKNNSENSQTSTISNDVTNEGGRPSVEAQDRSDKTQSNIDGKG